MLLSGCFLNVSMEICHRCDKRTNVQICLICILDLLAETINLPDSRDILNILFWAKIAQKVRRACSSTAGKEKLWMSRHTEGTTRDQPQQEAVNTELNILFSGDFCG